MMIHSVKLSLVERKNRNLRKIIMYSFFLVTLFLMFFMFFGESYQIDSIYYKIEGFLFFTIFITIIIRSFFFKDYNTIGHIIIDYEKIHGILHNTEFSFSISELDKFIIEINETASDSASRMTNKEGINNYLYFNIGDKNYEMLFHIENRTQVDFLINFFRNLKTANGMNLLTFKESNKGIRFTIK